MNSLSGFHPCVTVRPPCRAHCQSARRYKASANPRRVWEEMGAPTYPSASQLEALGEASNVTLEKQPFEWSEETVIFEIDLPPNSVVSIEVELRRESGGNRK